MNNVIIGAGQCGRGYLARLLALSKEAFTFIDIDSECIKQLRTHSSYQIQFCGSERTDITIQNYQAYTWQMRESIEALAQADVIFISIGEQHLPEVVPYLQTAFQKRTKVKKPIIITAENGTSPKTKLQTLEPYAQISESVIFCTTLGKKDTLDIRSEDLDHLPYDRALLTEDLPFYGTVAEYNFTQLLERKIYTYNSLSAYVAYLGYYKGYTVYGEAAHDEDIKKLCEVAKKELDQAIVKEYDISLQEQQEFSQMALAKFQNREIIDTIERNVRDVKRKLGEHERILAPMRMIQKHHGNPTSFYIVCAAALWYGKHTKTYDMDDVQHKQEVMELCKRNLEDESITKILAYYASFTKGISLSQICQEVQK